MLLADAASDTAERIPNIYLYVGLAAAGALVVLYFIFLDLGSKRARKLGGGVIAVVRFLKTFLTTSLVCFLLLGGLYLAVPWLLRAIFHLLGLSTTVVSTAILIISALVGLRSAISGKHILD